MRYIIYGVGAVGGTIAAALQMAGHTVVGLARGRMLAAIQADGLLLRTPAGENRVQFACHAEPAEIGFEPDDVIILCMKSQDTAAALEKLAEAGVREQPIICGQNGVNNERLALRLFPNVYGMTVMVPADYTVPGEVNCFGAPRYAMFDLGRYPVGLDETVSRVVDDFESANMRIFPLEEVMKSKYGKLRENLLNALEMALGKDVDKDVRQGFVDQIQTEGEAAFTAAGIAWTRVGFDNPRRKGVMEMTDIPGTARIGGSTTQSLTRGGSLETEYLNGEIALLGRLHGVATPANAALVTVARDMVAKGAQVGDTTPDDLRAVIQKG
ncbi:ketopantoate reductase family protein [Devosia sp.]|uniref:ketopantoate reductase family protein n=1 Tax=Devosia sp. TaxID=1871048 RepID=UPI003A8DDB81